MNYEDRCRNMNHSRMNVPIRFCPDCGEVVNKTINVRCDEQKHNARRKNQNTYCCDCGTKLR